MKYNFDEIIDRKGTDALSVDGFRKYMFKGDKDVVLPCKDSELIRMWVADMDFATPPEVVTAIKSRLDKRIFGYTKIFDPDYYNVFSRFAKKHYNWEIDKTHLVTAHGIIPALYELIEYICKRDEKILIFTPSYAYFKYAVAHNKNTLITSKLIQKDGHYTIDYDDVESKMSDDKLTLCIFCNPHNPTGRVWEKAELIKFGQLCEKNKVWVVSDEVHCDLLRHGQKHTPLAKLFPNSNKIVTCMAPSKTFNMAGMKIANIIIPNLALKKIWLKRHYSMENPLSIVGAKAAYEHAQDWLCELRIYLDNNFNFLSDYLKKYLPKAEFNISQATYLAWINIKAYLPDEENYPMFFAKNAGVLLEGGNMFVENADGYIRLNIACPRKVLKEGLQRITHALNK